jgi:hypothetical protein
MTGKTLDAYDVEIFKYEHKLETRWTAHITYNGETTPLYVLDSRDLNSMTAKIEMVLTNHTKGR